MGLPLAETGQYPAQDPAQEPDLLFAMAVQATQSGRALVGFAALRVNKLKYFRRIATRYDKLGSAYLAMIKLACIRIRLRHYESTA